MTLRKRKKLIEERWKRDIGILSFVQVDVGSADETLNDNEQEKKLIEESEREAVTQKGF